MHTDRLIGKTIENFIVKERIGRGGMALVYRAHQPAMNRDVALKIINLDDESVERLHFRERFANESAVIASLEHIHILPVYDYGISENIAYLAMRLLRGGTLVDLMGKEPLPLERTVVLFSQIARGLAHAHSKGVIHRDLKPGNIMLDDVGNAMLTDFGLAKIVSGAEEDRDMTNPGNIVGTPAYMSPEQLRGIRLDHRSDIYSMGIILYQMLAGTPPFDPTTSDIYAMIYKHLEEVPAPIQSHNPNVPAGIEAIVLKALAKAPEDRYNNIGDMVHDLNNAMGLTPSSTGYPLPAISIADITTKVWKLPQRKTPIYLLAILAIVAVALLALLVVDKQDKNIPVPTPTILLGETGTLADTIPTDNEISRAQHRVGRNGFIAFITCNRTSEYHAGYTREIVDTFGDYGLAVTIYDSNSNEARQIPLIEQARSEGATGLVICPLNIGLLTTTLESIKSAEIPLVLTHAGDHNYGGVAMGADDYLLGLRPGQFAGRLIRDELDGRAEVILLDYPDLPQIVRRADGLEDGLLEFAPDAHIVGRFKGATADFAYESVSELLEDGVIFNVIVSINDAGSFGAIDALDDADYEPDQVIVVSVDAEELAKEYIREEYFMHGSVALDRSQQTQAATNSMIKLLAGGTLPEIILTAPGDMVTRETLAAESVP
jgi:serine/threonine protein kinase/DNA-binding LacI/PurR family transcriptional regulator